MRTSIISLLVLGASAVFAIPSTTFNARQADADPCKCNDVGTALSACGTDLSCICKPAQMTALQACADCSAKVSPASADTLQNAITQYVNGCKAAGIPVDGASTAAASTVPAVTTSAAATTPAVAATSVAATTSAAAAVTTPGSATVKATTSASGAVSALPSVSGSAGTTSAGYKNLASGAVGVAGSVVVAAFMGFM